MRPDSPRDGQIPPTNFRMRETGRPKEVLHRKAKALWGTDRCVPAAGQRDLVIEGAKYLPADLHLALEHDPLFVPKVAVDR